MSTQELSAVALRVVDQYHEASRSLLNAYRGGAQRLLESAAARRGEPSKLNTFLSQRLEADTARISALIDGVANLHSQGIESVAAGATQVEQSSAVAFFDMLAALQLPPARVSEQIAARIAEGAKSIETRVLNGKPVADAAAKVAEAAEAVAEVVEDAVDGKAARKAARAN